MKRIVRGVIGLVALAVIGGFCQSSRADTVTATLEGLTPYSFPNMYLVGQGTIGGGAGAIGWQGQSGNALGLTGAFQTYCIDLIQDIYFGDPYTYDVQVLSTAPQPGAYPNGQTGGMGAQKASELNTLFQENFNNLSTDDDMQAFQLAIWSIVYDTPTQLANGPGVENTNDNFYVLNSLNDGTVISIADGYLTSAVNLSDQETFSGTLVALVGENGAQDQIYAGPPSLGSSPVPLPSSSIGGCVLLGMCGLGAVAKKRRAGEVA
jgi:hypothetical protein